MTLREAQLQLQPLGITLLKNDMYRNWSRTYQLTVYGETDLHWADDLDEAVALGVKLREERGPEGHICKECGEREQNHFFKSVAAYLTREQLCHSCSHWYEKIRWKANESESYHNIAAVVEGTHYTIHNKVNNPGSHCGHGGSLFRVRWFDGRVKESNDVWCQGSIPDRFRERLPDTAEFLDPHGE